LIQIDYHQDYADIARIQSPHLFDVGRYDCDVGMEVGGKTVGIEEKKPHDFENSYSSRRLQRQLRALYNNYDIPVLALRLEEYEFTNYTGFTFKYDSRIFDDLNKWSRLGVVAFIPSGPQAALDAYVELERILGADEVGKVSRIVAGDDRRKRKRGGSEFQTAIRNLIPKVGPTIAASIEAHFKGDFVAAMYTDYKEWAEIPGVHKGIVAEVEKLQQLGR